MIDEHIFKTYILKAIIAKSPKATHCGIRTWLITQRQVWNPIVIKQVIDMLINEEMVIETTTPECEKAKFDITEVGKTYAGIT
jgi:predicted transcriptional regulator